MIISYISFFEQIFRDSIKHRYILINLYFLVANHYVELDELGKALELYSECAKKIFPNENKFENQIRIYSFYNMGLIYYDTDQFQYAKNNLENCIDLHRKENNKIDNETSAIILETLGEIEIEYRKFDEALVHLKEALDIRKKKNITEDKISLKRISFLINFIYEQYNYQEEMEHESHNNFQINFLDRLNITQKLGDNEKSDINKNNESINNKTISSKLMGKDILNNSSNFMKKHFKIDEEAENDSDANFNYNFNNFFQSNMHLLNQSYRNVGIKVKDKDTEGPEEQDNSSNFTKLKEEEFDEIEKFFIFLTKLSTKEIEILNEDQKHTEKNIPIFFSDNFKNCLTYGQKIKLLEMKFMKLRRNIVLKNPKGKIEVDNLNYEILERKRTNKKIENSVQKYSNQSKLENWANNSLMLSEFTKSKDKTSDFNFNKGNRDIGDESNNENLKENEEIFNNNEIDFYEVKEKYDLNENEIYLFFALKNSLQKFLNEKDNNNNNDNDNNENENENENYILPSDKEISDYIKDSNEDEIKYFIKNPEFIFKNDNEDDEDDENNK